MLGILTQSGDTQKPFSLVYFSRQQKGPAERGRVKRLTTNDFQSEVGEVFGEIGGELPAKFGRRF